MAGRRISQVCSLASPLVARIRRKDVTLPPLYIHVAAVGVLDIGQGQLEWEALYFEGTMLRPLRDLLSERDAELVHIAPRPSSADGTASVAAAVAAGAAASSSPREFPREQK